MRRGLIATIVAVAVCLPAALTESASGMEFCAKPKAGEPSSWTEIRCLTAGVNGGFALILIPPAPVALGNLTWCAKVKAGEPSTWKDNLCSNGTAPTEYIKIVPLNAKFLKTSKYTGTSSKDKVETTGKTSLTCKTEKKSGEVKSETEGSLTLTLEGCETLGFKCNGLGAKEGTISIAGAIAPATTNLSPIAGSLILSMNETHIECPAIGTLLILKGEVLAGVTPIFEEAKAFTLTAEEKEGKQTIKEKYNEKGELEKLAKPLLVSVSGKAFEEAGYSASEDKLESEKVIVVAP